MFELFSRIFGGSPVDRLLARQGDFYAKTDYRTEYEDLLDRVDESRHRFVLSMLFVFRLWWTRTLLMWVTNRHDGAFQADIMMRGQIDGAGVFKDLNGFPVSFGTESETAKFIIDRCKEFDQAYLEGMNSELPAGGDKAARLLVGKMLIRPTEADVDLIYQSYLKQLNSVNSLAKKLGVT